MWTHVVENFSLGVKPYISKATGKFLYICHPCFRFKGALLFTFDEEILENTFEQFILWKLENAYMRFCMYYLILIDYLLPVQYLKWRSFVLKCWSSLLGDSQTPRAEFFCHLLEVHKYFDELCIYMCVRNVLLECLRDFNCLEYYIHPIINK